MKYDEAKRLIILEWDRWIQTQPIDSGNASGRDSLKFVLELRDARSALLNFQPKGRDKWRLIHAWLLSERRVAGGIGIHPYTAAANRRSRARLRTDSDDPVRRDRICPKVEDMGQPTRQADLPCNKPAMPSRPGIGSSARRSR